MLAAVAITVGAGGASAGATAAMRRSHVSRAASAAAGGGSPEIGEICCFCHDPLSLAPVLRLPCQHSHHVSCADRWIGARERVQPAVQV
jgi:hypothetical protein